MFFGSDLVLTAKSRVLLMYLVTLTKKLYLSKGDDYIRKERTQF